MHEAHDWEQDLKAITIAIFVCIFLLFRPYQMQQTGMMYGGDDHSYLAHATSIVYGQYPSYEKEYFNIGEGKPMHSMGAGIMAAPFVFIFSLIDRVIGSDIVVQRTESNITQSWTLFGFVIAACVYFWFACFLLHRGLSHFIESRYASWAVILMVLCQGIPLLVFRRPIFAHVFEFFLQSFMVYLLLSVNKERPIHLKRIWPILGIVVAGILIILVRYNNILAAFIWPIVLYGYDRSLRRKYQFWKFVGGGRLLLSSS